MATFSISATARKAQASGNGSAGPFSFAFQVNSQSEVDVFVDTTLKTLSTHYTVSLASNGTGTVSFTTGNFPSSSQTITIMGDAPLSRTSVYTSGGNITAAALESDFDTNVMVQQQQQELLSRTVKAPVDDAASVDLTLPNKDARKGKILGFNSTSGNPEATQQVTGAAVNVSTVSAGGNATASVAVSGGTATFALGIPTGATGAQGAQGAQGNAGSTGPQGNSGSSYTHPNHSGEVTSTSDGATVIASNVVDQDNLKVSNEPTNGYVLSAQSSNAGGLTWVAASGGGYSLPTAAGSTLGGVKVGSNLSINGAGVLSATDTNTTYSVGDGGLSQNNFTNEDHTKLNSIEASANNYSHPNGNGNEHIPANGSAGQFLKYDHAGTAVWAADNNTTYSVGDGGLTTNDFTNADHTKLNGIASGATAFTNSNAVSAVTAAHLDMGGKRVLFGNLYSAVSDLPSASTYHGMFAHVHATGLAYYAHAGAWVPLARSSDIPTVGDGGLSEINFTSADHTKLNGITASANNYTHPNHSGEVVSSADGAQVISDNVVDEANLKISNTGTNGHFLSYQSGNTGGLTWAAASGGGADLYAANESSPTAQPSATGTNSVAIGDESVSTGTNSFTGPESRASGTNSFALGIANNSTSYGATGNNTIAIGQICKATASGAVAIGNTNSSTGDLSLCLGAGNLSSASGGVCIGRDQWNPKSDAISMGRYTKPDSNNSLVWSSGRFNDHGDAQSSTIIVRAATTDATVTTMSTGPTPQTYNQINISVYRAVAFSALIVAREDKDNGSDNAAFKIEGLISREADENTTVLDASNKTTISNPHSWDVNVSADTTTGLLKFAVTGASSKNIKWVCTVTTSEVKYT